MENRQYAGFWGKTEKGRDPERRVQPLLNHLLDSAAVSLALWDEAFGPGFRERCSTTLGAPVEAARSVIACWIALHDLGKASPSFQGMHQPSRLELQRRGFPFPRRPLKQPHNFISAHVLPELLQSIHPSLDRSAARVISTALGGHHGSFPQSMQLNSLERMPDEIGAGPWEEARRELVSELARLIRLGETDWEPPPELGEEGGFFMALAGLTVLADWLASAESHFFPRDDAPAEPEAYWRWARERASEVVGGKLRWKRWSDAPAPGAFGDVFPIFKKEGLEPFPLQRRVAELAERLEESALVIIEAPMGEGKTEAALYLADRWLRRPGSQGIYFALPTTATSDQMFSRFRGFLEGRFPGQALNLHLLHSQAAMLEAYSELRRFAVGEGEDGEDNEEGLLAAEWFTGKKLGLLSPFAVGTVDQALLGVLQVRFVFLRLFGLADKVLLIDEVHAYDTYMTTLLVRLLQWMSALGAPVILLSATLPSGKRAELLEAYGAIREDAAPGHVPYPRISVGRPGAPVETETFATADKRRMRVELERTPFEVESVVSRMRSELAGGGCAAIICNTVNHAQEVYRALREHFTPDEPTGGGRGELGLLHARFPRGWRQDREKRYLEMLDKKGRRPVRFILVGTQILEQSLDLDFDLMATELAPADLVLQRMGRLHRHQREHRPEGLREPRLLLLRGEGDDDTLPDLGPSAFVYEPLVLLRSWLALERRGWIELPADIEPIIEEVYGVSPEAALGAAWTSELGEAESAFAEKLHANTMLARRNAIPEPWSEELFSEVNDLLSDDDNPGTAKKVQALTRLSSHPTVTVVCLEERDGQHRPIVHEGAYSANPLDPEDNENLKNLLLSSVAVSNPRVVYRMLEELKGGGWPPAQWRWKRNPLLRFAYPVVFSDGQARLGDTLLELDGETGLTITSAGGQQASG